MNKRIAVIVNVDAGPESPLAQTLSRAITENNIPAELFLCRSEEEINIRTELAIERGFSVIAAAGGDGTINCVASHLAGLPVALAVIPVGTLNHFAQDLGIPLNISQALKIAASGLTKQIDVGRVGDYIFLNNCSLGLYPKVVQLRESMQKKGWKKSIALVVAGFAIFRRFPHLLVKLHMKEQEIVRSTPVVFVGNNRYSLSGTDMGRRNSLDQHILSLFITNRQSRFGFIKLLMHLNVGKLSQQKDFEEFYTESLSIETPKKFLSVALDGEVRTIKSPLRFSIKANALTVLVPPPLV